VLRGTFRASERWCGRPDAVGLRPVDDDWSAAWTLRTVQAANWWNDQPYGALLVCGLGVDCIELPGSHSRRMLAPLREAGLRPPAMITPVGTMVLFARTYAGSRPCLVSVSLRSAGSWVAVPPTDQHSHGSRASGYRWLPDATPGALGWVLPELGPVCELITSTIQRAAGAARDM